MIKKGTEAFPKAPVPVYKTNLTNRPEKKFSNVRCKINAFIVHNQILRINFNLKVDIRRYV